jgi:hypothetical protein
LFSVLFGFNSGSDSGSDSGFGIITGVCTGEVFMVWAAVIAIRFRQRPASHTAGIKQIIKHKTIL